MQTKNVLFISHDGMTDPLGQSQVIPYLRGISRHGYRFFILSCEKKGNYQKNCEAVEKSLEGSAITWVPVWYHNKPPIVSTFYDMAVLRIKAKALHRKYGIDMVHTRSGVPPLLGMWLKKKYGIKFLHDIREFYADGRVDGGFWNQKNPLFRAIYKFFKKKEAEELAICDGAVCLTHAAEKIIRQLPYFNLAKPLQVIPCSVDMQLFNPAGISREELLNVKREKGIAPGDMVISYLGSIGGWYLTDEMIRFCKKLSDKIPAAKFLFISPHRHEFILEMATKYNLEPAKIITTHAKRAEVPSLLALSTYSIFFIIPCFSKLSSSPTKHAEIMAMGIPVITNSGVGDLDEIISHSSSGILLKDFTETSFDDAVEQIKQGMSFNPECIRQGAAEYYALPLAVNKYVELYDALLR
ncbi:MAG: glycosyltransferase [Ferruginibacter sp.]